MKFCNIKKNPHYRFAALSSRCFLCLCKYSYIMVSVCQSEVICSILQTCFFTSCVLFKLIISHSWVIYNMWIYLDQWVVRLFLGFVSGSVTSLPLCYIWHCILQKHVWREVSRCEVAGSEVCIFVQCPAALIFVFYSCFSDCFHVSL